jgi:hypothetical protein
MAVADITVINFNRVASETVMWHITAVLLLIPPCHLDMDPKVALKIRWDL